MKIHFSYSSICIKFRLSCLLIYFLFSGFLLAIYGTNYYVNVNSGSDSNPGTIGQPFKTIQKGINTAYAGDTVFVRAGTYTPGVSGLRFIRSGASGSPIVITNYNGESVTIDMNGAPSTNWTNNTGYLDNLTINGFNFINIKWAIVLQGSHNTISNNTLNIFASGTWTGINIWGGSHNYIGYNSVDGANWNGISIECRHNDGDKGRADSNLVEYNNCINSTGHMGINIFPNTSQAQDSMYYNIVRFNIMADNAQSGLYLRSQKNFECYGNLIYGNAQWGIFIHWVSLAASGITTSNAKFYNNTITGNGYDGFYNYCWNNVTLENNIITASGTSNDYPVDMTSYVNPSTITMDYNLYFSTGSNTIISWNSNSNTYTLQQQQTNLGYDLNSYQSNPLFNNVGNSEYTLGSGSPAIDVGVNLGALYNTDMNGNIRGADGHWDIGAYESTIGGSGGNDPPSQPANPTPGNGAINQNTNTTLSWTCSDPNGDPLTYDIYLGTTNNPSLVSSSQSNTSYDPGQLNENTTYYWKTVAKDNQGGTTSGPVWSFSTIVAGSGGGDVIPPELIGVQSVEANQVVLDFSEPLAVDQVSNLGNYLISDQLEVLGAELNPSHERITLTTDQQVLNHIYTIAVNNLTDTAGNVISSQANSLFYKLLDIGSIGYIEHLINNVNASATTDTNTSPAKTLDGLVNGDPDPNSRWAAQVMPQWIQYDLGAVEPISLIAVSFYLWNSGRIYQYSIQTSNDLVQWNDLVTNNTSSSQEWTFNEFTDLYARYVRVICLSNNQGDWAGVWETRIFEPENTTAVELTDFTARVDEKNNVVLNWTSATEENCKEFNITRKEGSNEFFTIGIVPGNGTITEPRSYTFTDKTLKGGHFSYRLEEVDFSGRTSYSNIVEVEVNQPHNFTLEQNYPNPFNPTTNISFSVPAESFVTLKVYDILGNEITTLVNEKKPQGHYTVEFSTRSGSTSGGNVVNLPSGIYLARMEAQGLVFIKKMVLLK